MASGVERERSRSRGAAAKGGMEVTSALGPYRWHALRALLGRAGPGGGGRPSSEIERQRLRSTCNVRLRICRSKAMSLGSDLCLEGGIGVLNTAL